MLSTRNACQSSESPDRATSSRGTQDDQTPPDTGMVDPRDITATNPTAPDLVKPSHVSHDESRSEEQRDA